jgi:2'-5' RNA ligase superfamily
MSKPESALVVLVPEAEPLVQPFRERFDPSAALGVPAHITLLYPFIEPERIGADTLDVVAACFRGSAPIAFSLTAVRRFPAETLYLAPDPDEPFRQLTTALWDRFPDTPPYGGAWPDIVPHLSVGRFADAGELERVADEFNRVAETVLPIRAHAGTAVLIVNTTGRWVVRSTFKLGT